MPTEQPKIDREASKRSDSRGVAAPDNQSASVDESEKASFPASDPPASHMPDVPPANADDKWKAAGISRKS